MVALASSQESICSSERRSSLVGTDFSATFPLFTLTTVPPGRYSYGMNVSTTRQAILEAANRLVQREGVARLTLEAVAQEAHLSKGGLRYHFPSKEALITGMIQDHLEAFEMELARLQERSPPGPGTWLRAYLHATYASSLPDLASASGMLVAIANNSALLEPLQRHYATWQARAEQDGLSAARATVIRLALDGLWFAEVFGLAPPNPRLREQVEAFLLALIQERGAGP